MIKDIEIQRLFDEAEAMDRSIDEDEWGDFCDRVLNRDHKYMTVTVRVEILKLLIRKSEIVAELRQKLNG